MDPIKMPGDEEQKFANLRSILAYMTAHPGKKLLFMGGEFGQWREWDYQGSLDWHLLEYPLHSGVQKLVRDLNRLYREEPALHRYDCEPKGFEWIDELDYQSNVICFLRRGDDPGDNILVVCHFADTVREGYRIGVPETGGYRLIFSSQDSRYRGWEAELPDIINSEAIECHGRSQSICVRLPALSVSYFKLT